MFSWKYVLAPDSEATQNDLDAAGFDAAFPSQAEAEAWLGEAYLDLVDYGVDGVTLLEDGEEIYGPMSLREG